MIRRIVATSRMDRRAEANGQIDRTGQRIDRRRFDSGVHCLQNRGLNAFCIRGIVAMPKPPERIGLDGQKVMTRKALPTDITAVRLNVRLCVESF